ncbi:phenylacetate--CoA ligase family protein [Micromonospora sp. DT228]|uniref:phenylacetate--CoA ligase family protein n=1 Tax=Micromonospora sp. DT228 TaxID=3393443 RepID=UPI003CEC0EAA
MQTDRTRIDAAALRRMYENVSSLPALREKYAGERNDGGELSIETLPVLTKDELAGALDDIVAAARSRSIGAYLYGSGGTTSKPKLSVVPTGMFVAAIRREWQPLSPNDMLVNFYSTGQLWSSHNFFNMLAHESGAVVLPLGSVEGDELGEWLDVMERFGVTALNATPSQIAHLLEHCEATGRKPPAIEKLLWTGEAYGDRAAELTRSMLPGAKIYGCYGSTETWVIGANGPDCALNVFHVMPYQHVELVDGVVLVTTTDPDCINPILRYQVGDRGEFVQCPCGRSEPGLRVLGRADTQVKFISVLVAPTELANIARRITGVRDVQLAFLDHAHPNETLQVRLLLQPGADAAAVTGLVRHELLTEVYRLRAVVDRAPRALEVIAVDRLAVNARTRKTPLYVSEMRG